MKEACTYTTDRYKIDSDEEAIITDKHLDNAIISFLCGLMIALTILGSLFVRGCRPEPVAACICEECGQIIGSEDHGRCQSTEVAYGK